MTPENELPPEFHAIGLEPDDLDGHTLEELSDYLDSGRTPTNQSIEASPGCQLALQSMSRLRELSHSLMDADADAAPPPSETWIRRILDSIALDARAGRRIPIEHPSSRADLGITEGAVRGIIRAAEADVVGTIIGRCRLTGDVTVPGAPVRVSVDASMLWGENIPDAAERLRAAVARRLAAHTDLSITGVDVTIHDIHQLPSSDEEEQNDHRRAP